MMTVLPRVWSLCRWWWGFEDGAFDDGVAAGFDIVFDEDVSSLGDFVVGAGVGGEAVAVGADDGGRRGEIRRLPILHCS